MIKRIVEVDSPARLTLARQQLVIEREGLEMNTVPVEDMGLLILNNPAITHSQALLRACWKNNVLVVVCDERHLPGAVLLPLEIHSLQSRVMAEQIKVTEPSRKRLWQDIVRAKIYEQARVLRYPTGLESALPALREKVQSGDVSNVEAQAARIYWRRLFGSSFRRGDKAERLNMLLNYGYALVRAGCARALVGAGLHPSIGLHHRNKYNGFCLADDLVEPLRPMVDLTVFQFVRDGHIPNILDREVKRSMFQVLVKRCAVGELHLPLMEALHHYTASLRQVICKEARHLAIPHP